MNNVKYYVPHRCTFDNNEQCGEWFRRLAHATAPPRQLQDMFAFCFKAWATERENEDIMARLADETDCITVDDVGFKSEVSNHFILLMRSLS